MGKSAGKSIFHSCARKASKKGETHFVFMDANPIKAKLITAIGDHLLLHYVPAATLAKMGHADLAKHLINKLPTSKTAKSGDLGEILAIEYINCGYMPYSAPIYRLSFKDGRDLALRGEDAIGFKWKANPVGFLKVEAKSRKSLQTTVVKSARKSLDRNKGLPTAFTLGYIIDRLYSENKDSLAALLKPYIGRRLPKSSQVEHMVFTFSEAAPTTAFRKATKGLKPGRTRYFVGMHIEGHQKVIERIYKRARNG